MSSSVTRTRTCNPTPLFDCDGSCVDTDYLDCEDCGICTLHLAEYYMLWNRVWEEAYYRKINIPELAKRQMYKGVLCIGCCEKRLGRKITKEDFTPAPINTDPMYTKGRRLKNRMGRV